ncbi:MAG: GTPase Era [Candidatus Woesearchaeota archaeon]
MFKSGFVTILGKPNVGKSTLLNSIVKSKLSIATPRPQTTRDNIIGILNDKNYQIVFVDTPGLLSAKTKLDHYMKNNIKNALEGVDVVLYMLDFKDQIEEEDIRNIEKFSKMMNGKVIVLVNKMDLSNRDDIYKKLSKLNNLQDVSDIIPISSTKNKNTDIMLKSILKLLPEGPKYYPENSYTDKTEKYLVSELIREKTLLYLHEEIPHGIAVKIEKFKNEDSIIEIGALIICSKASHKNIIIGKKGLMLKDIATSSRKAIERLLDSKVYLSIWVKVDENWRDSNERLTTLGYK